MITRSHTIFAAAVLALSAAAFAPATASAQVGLSIVIGDAPPPPRFASVPGARRGDVWAPGYWDWRGDQHEWVRGTWVRARQGYTYSQPQWIERNGQWYKEQGRWVGSRRSNDGDRDGVPDAQDRDLDNDGVLNGFDTDRDGDGYRNEIDRFRDDPLRW